MNQRKERTTVLFVNKGPQDLKPLQISSKLILNWKKYVVGLSAFFLLLVGAIVCLIINNFQQYQSRGILSQKINSMSRLLAENDSRVVRKKLTNIDKQLSTINSFLKARGIQTVHTESLIDKVDSNAVSAAEISDFYENYLDYIYYSKLYNLSIIIDNIKLILSIKINIIN